jgi:DNA repair exonuclease SbcCD nuclease subunit
VTRLAFIADLHLGNHKRMGGSLAAGLNRRCQLVADTLAAAGSKATSLGCDALVILGDVFDSSRPTPQMIAAVERAIVENAPPTIIVRGNHDMDSTAEWDDALGPLSFVSGIHVVTQPELIPVRSNVEVMAVPFFPGDAREWFPPMVEELAQRPRRSSAHRLLAFHLGIIEQGATPFFLLNAEDAIPLETLDELVTRHKLSGAFAGNWHGRALWMSEGAPVIAQAGTIAPTGFDDEGFDDRGGMLTWSDVDPSKSHIHHVPGPRFVTVVEADEQVVRAALAPAQPKDSVFLRFKVPHEQAARAAELTAWLTTNHMVADATVELTGSEEKSARNVLEAVLRLGASKDEALHAYVKNFAGGDDARTERITAQVKGFLSKVED